MVLEQEGYTASLALNGESGIEMASRIGPRLAIVDINLPDADGIEIAIEICRRVRHCKILLMTGDPESAEKLDQARRRGINLEVVGKPIQLLQKLQTLLQ